MIKPALLYKDKLQRQFLEHWYAPETKFFSGACCSLPELLDNNQSKRQLVSVDKDGSVIGYIEFNIDWCTRSAQQWGMISFDKGNLTFVRDLQSVIEDLFLKENFNRVEWWCYKDNPAVKGYERFIDRFGGRIVGPLRQCSAFSDGTLHDTYIFEILKSDLKKENSMRRKYHFIDEFIEHDGCILHRIQAMINIPEHNVHVGDIGGFLATEESLSHHGTAWVTGECVVSGAAYVGDDALVDDNAIISGNAIVRGCAHVAGGARVSQYAIVDDYAYINNSARIYGHAIVDGHAKVLDQAHVFDYARVKGHACVCNTAHIGGTAYVSNYEKLSIG